MPDLNQELGSHRVKVDGVQVVDKTGHGDIQVIVGVRFKDGERGVKYLTFGTEKSVQFARKSLKAIGFDIDAKTLDDLAEKPTMLDGNECEAVVQENEYNGKITNQIAFLNAIPKPAGKAKLKDLTAKLRNTKTANAEEAL